MASCPFRRTSSHSLQNGALKKSFTSRQSSIQIPTEDQDDEDKNTLNLKHLNDAILTLTAPPVSIFQMVSDLHRYKQVILLSKVLDSVIIVQDYNLNLTFINFFCCFFFRLKFLIEEKLKKIKQRTEEKKNTSQLCNAIYSNF